MKKINFFICFILNLIFLGFLVIYLIQLIKYIIIINHKLNNSNIIEFNNINIHKPFKKETSINKEKSFNLFNIIINKIINVKYKNNLEYASFILDIFLAFIFILLPLMHYYNIGKNFEKIIEKIGKIAGFIAYILTFFTIYNFYDIKNKDKKEFLINTNISSSKNIYDYQIKDYNQNNNIFLNRLPIFINEKKDNPLGKKEDKKYIFEKLKKSKIIESNSNNKDRNYLYNKYYDNIFLHLIIIILNIFLAISGFLLYRNNFSSKRKDINRLKNYKRKK